MPTLPPSDYLIDTGAVELFLDPPDKSIAAFWTSLGKVRHAICEVVYWEFMRQFDLRGNSVARQRFVKALDRGLIESLPIDRDTAELGVSLYQYIRNGVSGNKSARRARMNELQCDILIAAVAVRHGKIVVTDDPLDWALLRGVVAGNKIGTLPILLKDEMRDPSKWKK
ncbi:MAG: type II toxin-antitoxin system VapC family toxin [Phycisphaerales bacterium]